MTQSYDDAQPDHWTERGRAASVSNSKTTGRPRRSVPSLDNATRMDEMSKIVAIALTPFLVLGGLLYFTHRNRKVQFFVLLPFILATTVGLGFSNGWRVKDFLQLGFLLVWGVVGSFLTLRSPVQK